MAPVWEQRIEPDPGDDTEQAGPDEQAYPEVPGDPVRGVGPIQQVETQVLVDGEPVTVTDAARRQPGETPAEAIARARQRLREDAGEIRDDVWDQVHQVEEPDEQVTAY